MTKADKELVDILAPPDFKPTGAVKSLKQAWLDEEWTGTFNLWIIDPTPIPSIVYQVRSPNVNWAPGKLDVSCAGHYNSGESKMQGIQREAYEELGLTEIQEKDLYYLGRRLNISRSTDGHMHKTVIDVYFTKIPLNIKSRVLELEEVYAITKLPITELKKMWQSKEYSFSAIAYTNKGEEITIEVGVNKFPYNWDNYHYKIVNLAQRYLKDEDVFI